MAITWKVARMRACIHKKIVNQRAVYGWVTVGCRWWSIPHADLHKSHSTKIGWVTTQPSLVPGAKKCLLLVDYSTSMGDHVRVAVIQKPMFMAVKIRVGELS